ncbi:MAG: VOC family protein [Pseudomonadota bacterium]
MSRTVHFEIQASKPQQLIDYYGSLLGWTFNKWEGGEYWLINTGPDTQRGINGGLLPRRGPAPAANDAAPVNAFVNTIDVSDLDSMLAKATSLGGSVCAQKMAVAGVGWLAYIKDPDGNIFGMLQPDAKAK